MSDKKKLDVIDELTNKDLFMAASIEKYTQSWDELFSGWENEYRRMGLREAKKRNERKER